VIEDAVSQEYTSALRRILKSWRSGRLRPENATARKIEYPWRKLNREPTDQSSNALAVRWPRTASFPSGIKSCVSFRWPRTASFPPGIKPCVSFHSESCFRDFGPARGRRVISAENQGSSQRLGPRAPIVGDRAPLVCGVGDLTVADQNAATGRSAGGTSISHQRPGSHA